VALVEEDVVALEEDNQGTLVLEETEKTLVEEMSQLLMCQEEMLEE
jgi:hypothetical protein